MQLKIYNIEEQNAEDKHKIGDFTKLHWYAGQQLHKELKSRGNEFPHQKMTAIKNIYKHLKGHYRRSKKYKDKNIPATIDSPNEFLKEMLDDIKRIEKKMKRKLESTAGNESK